MCFHYWSGKLDCAEFANGCTAYDWGLGRRNLAQGDFGGAELKIVSYGVVDAPAPPTVSVFEDVVMSHLHHLETKYHTFDLN